MGGFSIFVQIDFSSYSKLYLRLVYRRIVGKLCVVKIFPLAISTSIFAAFRFCVVVSVNASVSTHWEIYCMCDFAYA